MQFARAHSDSLPHRPMWQCALTQCGTRCTRGWSDRCSTSPALTSSNRRHRWPRKSCARRPRRHLCIRCWEERRRLRSCHPALQRCNSRWCTLRQPQTLTWHNTIRRPCPSRCCSTCSSTSALIHSQSSDFIGSHNVLSIGQMVWWLESHVQARKSAMAATRVVIGKVGGHALGA
jgi:hypothetical protein